jgi:hypothetical protein
LVRWIRIGGYVGAVNRVDKAAILGKIGKRPFDQSLIRALCVHERYDCVLTSATNASLVMNLFLSGRLYPTTLGRSPFYLVPALLGPDRPWDVWEGHHSLSDMIENFNSERKMRSEPELDVHSDFFRECFDLSIKIADTFADANMGESKPSQWETLIEDARNMWGTRPLIVAAALRLANSKFRTRRKATHPDILNSDEPLCARIRTAMSERGRPEWWVDQFGRAGGKPFGARLLLYLSFIILAPVNVLVKLADTASEALDSLPSEEWSIVLSLASEALDRVYPPPKKQPTRPTFPVSDLGSPRLAYFVALREPNECGRSIFAEFFLRSGDTDYAIARFRQGWALDAAAGGALDWAKALEVVRSTYMQQGATYPFLGLARALNLNLPEACTVEILANPEHYPTYLWDAAERSASATARAAIRAVGAVAKKDKWFGN